MIHTEEGPGVGRAIPGPAGFASPRRGVSWILAAIGLLVAGLVGGTLMFAWRPDWMWPFPLAGFIGYVLAFRRGMIRWNPNIDRTWRRYFWLDRDTDSEENQPANGRLDPSEGAKSFRIVRPEPHRPDRPELRVVR